ncbi:HU family DNA-binding protein [Clostridium botulinum]|uniref:HU family DNA-binding protein n=1 Tax=Clostridium botulinum TaxID=1491 RepID=UPI001C9AFAF0|nr:HU family DNA-binding protein [Clostridium botulinum]MBY6838819.1 HU family DNA-binding protein [Clostridium botulinum]
MLKKEVLGLIKEKLELGSIKEVEGFVEKIDNVIEAIGEHLEIDDKATIGKLQLTKKKSEARVGRNPKTGEPVNIPEKISIKAKIK